MTARDLGNVGIRLVGLMAIVQALQTAPTIFGMMALTSSFGESPAPMALLSYLPGAMLILALVALGVSIIAYAPAIGARLFPQGETVAWSIGAEDLQVVLFSAVGALLLVESLPAVLRDVVTLAIVTRQGIEVAGGGILGQNGIQLAESLLRSLLGLYLLLNGRGLVEKIERLRRPRTGVQVSDDDS